MGENEDAFYDLTGERVEDWFARYFAENATNDIGYPLRVTTEEFKRYWNFHELFILHHPNEAVSKSRLPSSSKAFLLEIGVPVCALPDFEFFDESEFFVRLSEYHHIASCYDRFLVIGQNVNGGKFTLCVDEESGRVVLFLLRDLLSCLETLDANEVKLADSAFQPNFVNSSIEQLFHCCLAHEVMARETKRVNGSEAWPDKQIPLTVRDWYINWIPHIDSAAIVENRFWAKIIRELPQGV